MDGEELSTLDLAWRETADRELPAGVADRLADGVDGPVEHAVGLDAAGVARRLAVLAADGAPHGTTAASGVDGVSTDTDAGGGGGGADDSLAVGVLLRDGPRRDPDRERDGRLTVVGALATAGALASTGRPGRPRWPDAAVIDTDPWQDGPFYAAVSSGSTLPPAVAVVDVERAGPDAVAVVTAGADLGATVGGPAARAGFVVAFVAYLLAHCRAAEGADSGLRAEWRGRDALVGRRVRVTRTDGTTVEGRAVDVTAGGGLVLRCDDGEPGPGPDTDGTLDAGDVGGRVDGDGDGDGDRDRRLAVVPVGRCERVDRLRE